MQPADLEAVPAEVWKKLASLSGAWRTPVLASVTSAGCADARTVVLREVSDRERSVIFFTDRRSRKMPQLASRPGVCLLVYDQQASWQVRLYGECVPVGNPVLLDRWWTALAALQRSHYATDAAGNAPGNEKGRENFAAFRVSITRFHCLWLFPDHNEAAEFEWRQGRWQANPVRP